MSYHIDVLDNVCTPRKFIYSTSTAKIRIKVSVFNFISYERHSPINHPQCFELSCAYSVLQRLHAVQRLSTFYRSLKLKISSTVLLSVWRFSPWQPNRQEFVPTMLFHSILQYTRIHYGYAKHKKI